MQIKGPSLPVRLVLEQLKSELVQQLRPGQTLKATVLSENQNGLLKLALGNTTVNAQTGLKLTPGTALQLEVVRAGQQPELRALLPQTTDAIQAQALRSALPKAQPLTQVFEQLGQILGKPESTNLSPRLQQILAQLLGSIARYQDLSEQSGLSRLLGSSGLLFESGLLKGSPPEGDTKSTLLRLLTLLQGATPKPAPAGQPPGPTASAPGTATDAALPRLLSDLFALTESALARIELNQLASLPSNNAGQPTWQFELPVLTEKGYESVWIQIGREGGGGPENERTDGWNVTLQLNLDALGPVRAGVHLLGETVRTSFVAERVETAQLINEHMDTLRRGLNRAGLEVSSLDVHQGIVSAPETFAPGKRQRLLDERA